VLIAVIEDQQAIIDYVRLALEGEGYRIAAWQMEAGAHDFVRRTQPAVVLLDLHLEERDAGIRIAEALRADGQTGGVPVILATAQVRLTRAQYDRLRVLHCGWLAKPYTFGTLLSVVARAMVGVIGELPEPEG
jgi:CheY-like chemotaxis protein